LPLQRRPHKRLADTERALHNVARANQRAWIELGGRTGSDRVRPGTARAGSTDATRLIAAARAIGRHSTPNNRHHTANQRTFAPHHLSGEGTTDLRRQ
jgi:hypothetical protein